jgi:hypothetical protein
MIARGVHGGLLVHSLVTVFTLLALAAVIFAVARTHQRNQTIHRRKALQICEDGLMVALQRLSEEPSWREGISRTEHGDGWYEVSVGTAPADSASRIRVVARGSCGRATRQQQCILELTAEDGDSVWVQMELVEH